MQDIQENILKFKMRKKDKGLNQETYKRKYTRML